MQPSRNPIRFQYRTPTGEVKWSETRYCIHDAKILGWELVAAGNVIEGTFRDYVGGGRTEGAHNQYAPPAWVARLHGRRVC